MNRRGNELLPNVAQQDQFLNMALAAAVPQFAKDTRPRFSDSVGVLLPWFLILAGGASIGMWYPTSHYYEGGSYVVGQAETLALMPRDILISKEMVSKLLSPPKERLQVPALATVKAPPVSDVPTILVEAPALSVVPSPATGVAEEEVSESERAIQERSNVRPNAPTLLQIQ